MIVREYRPSRLTVPLPQTFRDSGSGLFHQKGLRELEWNRHSISQQYPAGTARQQCRLLRVFAWTRPIQRSCSHVFRPLVCQLPPIRDKLLDYLLWVAKRWNSHQNYMKQWANTMHETAFISQHQYLPVQWKHAASPPQTLSYMMSSNEVYISHWLTMAYPCFIGCHFEHLKPYKQCLYYYVARPSWLIVPWVYLEC